ncbi:hypothetical protein PHSY_001834 [Pseudozyma hubeiensis SY62]|uniref:Uncharacterized protein n=1 Tax=Pseudozyma hubeiensis (strain SY62) TaxID=1305764 RepID=R9NZH6_PSEHS|nr:hypothetical protein PHSY_001834 [Pseudozyma hubeiensis SY62]GAC94263.1 hypothetical protein PHSY_001834 [Pseudozyma hubeiensis SY62]
MRLQQHWPSYPRSVGIVSAAPTSTFTAPPSLTHSDSTTMDHRRHQGSQMDVASHHPLRLRFGPSMLRLVADLWSVVVAEKKNTRTIAPPARIQGGLEGKRTRRHAIHST